MDVADFLQQPVPPAPRAWLEDLQHPCLMTAELCSAGQASSSSPGMEGKHLWSCKRCRHVGLPGGSASVSRSSMQSCQGSVSISLWRCGAGRAPSSGSSSSWESAGARQERPGSAGWCPPSVTESCSALGCAPRWTLWGQGCSSNETRGCSGPIPSPPQTPFAPATPLRGLWGSCPPSPPAPSTGWRSPDPCQAQPWIEDSKGNCNLPTEFLLPPQPDPCSQLPCRIALAKPNGYCTAFPKHPLFISERSKSSPT